MERTVNWIAVIALVVWAAVPLIRRDKRKLRDEGLISDDTVINWFVFRTMWSFTFLLENMLIRQQARARERRKTPAEV